MASTLLLLAAWALAGLAAGATCLERTHVLPQGWQQLADEPGQLARPLRMSLALRQPGADGLGPALAAGTRLSAADVAALRTPDRRDVADVLGWLADHGIAGARLDQDMVHVSTTVAQAQALLGMTMHRYSFDSRAPVLRTTEYSVPERLAGTISFIHPIANFMTPTHEVAALRPLPPVLRRAEAPCSAVTTPDCVARQYNMSYVAPYGPSPARLGVAGFLDQFANFNDTAEFLRRTRPALAGASFAVELVHGGQNPQEPERAGFEANLDVEYAVALGHPAPVTYFSTGGRGVKLNDSGQPLPDDGSDNEPYLDLLDHLLAKPDGALPHVLSVSYADDELSVPRPYAERVCRMLGMLAGRGTSVLLGSGDGGARGGRNSSCRTNDGSNRDVTMATFPASCPWVTAVGAVSSHASPPPGADFSTGGFSQYFARPPWQDDAVDGYVRELAGHLAGYYDARMRAIPDISAVGTQFMTIVAGEPVMLDGTSASTPVLAAMVALVNDAHLRRGKPPLGWLNARLYSPAVRAVLVDTTEGQSISCRFSNGSSPGGWPAKKGWDAITGLGTPGRFDDLLRVLAES